MFSGKIYITFKWIYLYTFLFPISFLLSPWILLHKFRTLDLYLYIINKIVNAFMLAQWQKYFFFFPFVLFIYFCGYYLHIECMGARESGALTLRYYVKLSYLIDFNRISGKFPFLCCSILERVSRTPDIEFLMGAFQIEFSGFCQRGGRAESWIFGNLDSRRENWVKISCQTHQILPRALKIRKKIKSRKFSKVCTC